MSIKQAIEALETCLAMAEHGDFSTGYCCCGSPVEGHTMGDGHSPVDEGDYHAINAFDKARAALAALRSMPAEPVAKVELFTNDHMKKLYEAAKADPRTKSMGDEGWFVMGCAMAEYHIRSFSSPFTLPPAPVLSDAEILALWSGSDIATRPVLGSKKVIAFARAILGRTSRGAK